MPDEQANNEQGGQPVDYDPDEMIGTSDASKILNVSASYIVRLIKREVNPLPAKLIGKMWLIRRGDLEDFRDRPPRGRPKST